MIVLLLADSLVRGTPHGELRPRTRGVPARLQTPEAIAMLLPLTRGSPGAIANAGSHRHVASTLARKSLVPDRMPFRLPRARTGIARMRQAASAKGAGETAGQDGNSTIGHEMAAKLDCKTVPYFGGGGDCIVCRATLPFPVLKRRTGTSNSLLAGRETCRLSIGGGTRFRRIVIVKGGGCIRTRRTSGSEAGSAAIPVAPACRGEASPVASSRCREGSQGRLRANRGEERGDE